MMDLATAARLVDGRVSGGNPMFARVTTDSRRVAAGDLFVALAGERFDGHDFVDGAFAQGAAAAMVRADRDGWRGPVVAVDDTLAALGRLAAGWRARFDLPLALVVGSNGKTSVKEMIASILREQFGAPAVLATAGNLNNAIGLPLTLLALGPAHRAAVVELGMNHRGETRGLAGIAAPTIVVVTNAQREHQEFMASVAEVADEHADAIAALSRGGLAVLNADDPSIDVWRAAAARAGARVATFGFAASADLRGEATCAAGATALTLVTPQGRVETALAAPGEPMARNAFAAACVALAAGATPGAVARGLAAFRPAAGRLALRTLPSGRPLVDDTYNANPDSVRAAIDVLAAMPAPRVLVLGDMGEVGAQGPAYHREIGAYARERGIARLVAVGELARHAVDAFGDGASHHAGTDAAAAAVAPLADAGASILVKGSRFMRMERVVAALVPAEQPAPVGGGGTH